MKSMKTLNDADFQGRERTVVVLGAGRGGTSAAAGCLRELGVAMPNAHPLKHEWSPVNSDTDQDSHHLQMTFSEINSLYPIWGWKSPKDVFIFDRLTRCARNLMAVVVVRNPADISWGISKYEDMEIEIGFSEVIKAYEAISRFIRFGSCPIALLSYEEMLKSPRETAEALDSWIGTGASENKLARASSFINPDFSYRAISSEDQHQKIDPEELMRDRLLAQSRIYPGAIKDLFHRFVALEQDIIEARKQVAHLRTCIAELASERFNSQGVEVDKETAWFMSEIGRRKFLDYLKLDTSADRTIDVDVTNLQRSDFPVPKKMKDVEVNCQMALTSSLLKDSYRDIKLKYSTSLTERLRLQNIIDEFAHRIKILNDAKMRV